MNLTFDLNALRTVVAGAKLGSFARAAEHLGRSQSAVSMQLKKLEEQAGVQLFVRNGNKLVPTEAGQTLLDYASRMVALNDEAAASIGNRSSGATVRLGMPQDFASQILPCVLKLFSDEFPNVHVEAHIGRNFALAEEVRLGQLDVALVFTADRSHENGELIADLDMVWACPASCEIVKDGMPVPLVAFNFPCEFRKHGVEALETAGRSWRYALTTPSLAGIWAAISADMGVTVRTKYQTPKQFLNLRNSASLPRLPQMFVRQIEQPGQTPAASTLSHILKSVATTQLECSSVGNEDDKFTN